MISSTKTYWPQIDHLRAFAALQVWCWHFCHAGDGHPLAFTATVALVPLNLLLQGFCGVALFITLSGYLFAKLINDQPVRWTQFYLNRALRIWPLMLVYAAYIAWRYVPTPQWGGYARQLFIGLGKPRWPGMGLWIVTEEHCYILLPALLWLFRKARANALVVLALMLALRFGLWRWTGSVRNMEHMTVIGRLDEFCLGILAWQYRDWVRARRWLAWIALGILVAFYTGFAAAGSFNGTERSSLWVWLPELDGLCFATLICLYDATAPRTGWLSRAWARIGTWSYSSYIWNMEVVFVAAFFIHVKLVSITGNPYITLACAGGAYILWSIVCSVSYNGIEKPWLRLRRPYLVPA